MNVYCSTSHIRHAVGIKSYVPEALTTITPGHLGEGGRGVDMGCLWPMDRHLESPTFTLSLKVTGVREEERGEAGKCGLERKNAYEMG